MASGPCLRRCRVVRRYMPTNIKCHRLYVKLSSSIHVSMYFEPFQRVNAANTGFPCPKVPIRRKLRPGCKCPKNKAGVWHTGPDNMGKAYLSLQTLQTLAH